MLSLVCVATAAHIAVAEEGLQGAIPPRISRLSDVEVNQRLTYLEQHLDEGRGYAWWWWSGWTAFYSIGVVVEATHAGVADSDAKRADYTIGAVKATAGVIRLLVNPLEAKDGADAIRTMPSASPTDRRRQLVAAEEQLKTNSDVAETRYSWKRHAINVAVNAAGAIIVWQGFGDASRGWRSAGIATAIGEAQIWSQPWWPTHDWENYQNRFDADAGQRVSWHLKPTIGGVALQVDF